MYKRSVFLVALSLALAGCGNVDCNPEGAFAAIIQNDYLGLKANGSTVENVIEFESNEKRAICQFDYYMNGKPFKTYTYRHDLTTNGQSYFTWYEGAGRQNMLR